MLSTQVTEATDNALFGIGRDPGANVLKVNLYSLHLLSNWYQYESFTF